MPEKIKCRRCRKTLDKCELVDKWNTRHKWTDKCCPNCGCKTFTPVEEE